MSETRSHISSDNILHIAEVAKRRRLPTWKIIAIVIFGIAVVVGLLDLLSRLTDAIDTAHAAASLAVVTDVLPTPERLASSGSPAASRTATKPLVPTRLQIPSIGVDAKVDTVGLNATGAMQAPPNFTDVGWFESGGKPGGAGSAVFDGHVNNALTKAGVFEHLAQVQEGDEIVVSDAAGASFTYKVISVKTYPVSAAPEAEIFSKAGPSQLALITCDGVWNDSEHQFSNRLVVYAVLQ